MEFEVLFLFSARQQGCETFNAFVAVTGDMTIGEMIVAAQEHLFSLLADQHKNYTRGKPVVCDATQYDIDFHISLD